MKEKYIRAHMEAAGVYAKTSSAERLKVGCLIVKNDTPIAIGINGTYKGLSNDCESPEGVTYPWVRHAEAAALDKLIRSTESSDGAVMFITHSPCLQCAYRIVESGIRQVYYKTAYRSPAGLEWLQKNGVSAHQIE